MWGVRMTCILPLMLVHILTKVCNKIWGAGTCTQRHTGVHIFYAAISSHGEDMGSQVNMHTCTDVWKHYNQSVGIDNGCLGYADGATQGCTGFYTAM